MGIRAPHAASLVSLWHGRGARLLAPATLNVRHFPMFSELAPPF